MSRKSASRITEQVTKSPCDTVRDTLWSLVRTPARSRLKKKRAGREREGVRGSGTKVCGAAVLLCGAEADSSTFRPPTCPPAHLQTRRPRPPPPQL